MVITEKKYNIHISSNSVSRVFQLHKANFCTNFPLSCLDISLYEQPNSLAIIFYEFLSLWTVLMTVVVTAEHIKEIVKN